MHARTSRSPPLLLQAAWLALLLCAGAVQARPILLHADADAVPIGSELRVYADPEGRLTPAHILDGAAEDWRMPLAGSPPNLGYPRAPLWVRIDLRNEGTQTLERLLVLWRGSNHRHQAYVEVVSDDGRLSARRSVGADIDSRHSVLRLSVPPRSTIRVVDRIETSTALSLDYRLYQSDALAAVDRIDYLLFGILAGIVCAIGIYVLALYFALRERLYLLFAAFSIGNVVYQLHTEGYAYLMWPEHLRPLGNAVGTFSGTLFAIMIILFVRDYLSLRVLVPRLDRRVLSPVVGLLLSVFVAYPLAPWIGNTLAALGVMGATVVVGLAALRAAQLARPVWSFLGATLAFFALGVIHLLKRIGLLPDVQALSMVLQLGSAATTIAFAIAVMERIRRMVEERRQSQLEYADRLAHQVEARTRELSAAKTAAEGALAKLRETQQQLVESEKLASLGQLVAGVAHEVNTPLGIAVTASSHLSERCRAIASKLADGSLARGELEAWLAETRTAGSMIERNLERAAHLVRSFKQVSVDRTSDGRRRFVLATQIDELIESLQVTWKRRPVALEVDCPKDIELDSFPGALGQVLTNLIQNALLHAFEPDQRGRMRIAVRMLDAARIELVFEDDGRGLDADTLARIFDPFFTTKRNQGGTGLGLNIAYNLVAQKLGGRLTAESAPGKGLRLVMQLPRVAP